MAKQLGILIGDRHTRFVHPGVVEHKQVVPAYLRKVLEMNGSGPIPQGALKQAVQKYVNEYGETVLENQYNDDGKVERTQVSYEEVAYHLSYQGWITEDGVSIDNQKHAQLLVDWMTRHGVQDYDGTSLAQQLNSEVAQ